MRLASLRVLMTKFLSLSNMKIGMSRGQNSRMLVVFSLVSGEWGEGERGEKKRKGDRTIVYTCHMVTLPDTRTSSQRASHEVTKNTRKGKALPGGEISVATARALKFLWPSITALPRATLSAHVPTG